MRSDDDACAEQRKADALRDKHGISYEQALRHAVDRGLSYAEAVRELVSGGGARRSRGVRE